jgi:hypothetical protein
MADAGIDLNVVRDLEFGEQPAEPLPGTSAKG